MLHCFKPFTLGEPLRAVWGKLLEQLGILAEAAIDHRHESLVDKRRPDPDAVDLVNLSQRWEGLARLHDLHEREVRRAAPGINREEDIAGLKSDSRALDGADGGGLGLGQLDVGGVVGALGAEPGTADGVLEDVDDLLAAPGGRDAEDELDDEVGPARGVADDARVQLDGRLDVRVDLAQVVRDELLGLGDRGRRLRYPLLVRVLEGLLVEEDLEELPPLLLGDGDVVFIFAQVAPGGERVVLVVHEAGVDLLLVLAGAAGPVVYGLDGGLQHLITLRPRPGNTCDGFPAINSQFQGSGELNLLTCVSCS